MNPGLRHLVRLGAFGAALPLLLAACAAPPTAGAAGGPAPPPLVGTSWQLGADGPQAARLVLAAEGGRASGFGGCNAFGTPYTLDGARLSFGAIVATRRACLQEDGAEDRFFAALAQVRGWRIQGGQLELLSGSGGTLLQLRPGAATPR